MPHVALVAFTGFRVREQAMLELGMSLPALAERGQAIGRLPALGLLTLAGLSPRDWEVSYHEAGGGDDDAALAAALIEMRPTVVALSALTASVNEAYAFSRRLRAAGVRVVIGGLHATTLPDEALDHCDAVVVGDGEPVWGQLLEDAELGRLAQRYEAQEPFDLARSPLPRLELLGQARRPRYTIQTQRGCPLACDFCAASRLLGPFREKPVDRIADELAAIATIRPRPVIELADDNTFAGRRGVEPLFEVLAASGARYFTEADWRIGERPDVLAGLAESGCVQVLIGIETLDPHFAGMGPKRGVVQRVLEAVEAVQATGVAVIGCFVVGADGETAASIDTLGTFLEESPFADIQLTLQTPFPGTALRRRMAREGRLLPDRDWSYHTLFDVTYQPDGMGVAELESRFRDLVRGTFGPGPSNRRAAIRHKIWSSHPRFRDTTAEVGT